MGMMRPPTYRGLTVSAGLHATAEATPGRAAIRVGDQTLSYGQLAARLRRVTGGIRKLLGRTHGERVLLLAPNCIEYIELVCGLSDAGLIVSTVSPRSTARELTALAADCTPRVVFVHPDLEPVVRAASLPSVERTLVLGADYESWLVASPEDGIEPELQETDAFALVYTSGTTGQPKGVLISHRSRTLTFFAMAMEYGCFGPEDRHLSIAPMAHGAGFAFTMAPIFFGGHVEVLPRFDPERVLHSLDQGMFSGTFMVPTHYQAILTLETSVLDRYRGRTPALKSVISNAAALPQATKEKIVDFFGEGVLHEAYGSTEGGVVTNLRPRDQLRKIQCVGTPFACTSIRLLDDEGAEVEPDQVGELYSASPFLFSGYWNRPEETGACMRDGYVSVGDVARRDTEGYLYIVDRKKDMVISGGLNIYPREIEEVLHHHPSIREAAVIGVPDERWGERLRAFVVTRPDTSLDLAELEAFCRDRLSSYKVPRELRIVDELPRNAAGKVLKHELRRDQA